MNMNKAHWVSEGDNVRLSMPIGKVDKERRIVSGFATLDNIDKQGDIVTTEASLQAFKNFRGNLREMHMPSAVGKVVSFKEDRYFDPNTKKFYNGVYVSAYVSKGAQDAWEKVLDGTYTGFSIGGNITKYDDIISEETTKTIRLIKEYDLFELSLVDSPANQFASIISIEKVDGQDAVNGYLSKAEILNVYWCNTDDIVMLSDSGNLECPSCAKGMSNTGFVEKEDKDNADTIKFLVDSAKGIKTIKMEQEESPMTEDTNAVVEEVVEESATAEATPEVNNVEVDPEAQVEAEAAAPAEESAPSDSNDEEEKQGEDDLAKSDAVVAETVAEIKTTLANAFGDLAATIKSLDEKVAELSKSLSSVTNDVAGVTSKVAEVAQDVSTVKGSFNEFGKRVDKVEADTAFRKSGDLGEIVQEPVMVQKSLWGGRFLNNADLFN